MGPVFLEMFFYLAVSKSSYFLKSFIRLAKKYCSVVFNFIETISFDCTGTAVTSACIKKKLIGEFLCSQFNIEDGRKYTPFSLYYALLFQER